MKNKFNNGRYNDNYISPKLEKLFIHLKIKNKTKNIKTYLSTLVALVENIVLDTKRSLREIVEKPLVLQKEKIFELDEYFYNHFDNIIAAIEECRTYYYLNLHQVETLNDIEEELKCTSFVVYELAEDINQHEEGHFLLGKMDSLTEEIFCSKDSFDIESFPISPN